MRPVVGQPRSYPWRNAWVALSVVAFMAALTQPAFFLGGHGVSTASLLLQGWRGLPEGYIEWLANPALLASWIAVARSRRLPALLCTCAALVLMLAFLARASLRSAGAAVPISAHGAGFWLWLASALAMLPAHGDLLLGVAKLKILPTRRT